MHWALARWMLGYPRTALDRGRRGLTLARDLAHPMTVANAAPFLPAVQQLRGAVEDGHELADSTIELSAAHSLPQWLAIGRMLSEWVQAERGHGVARLQRAGDDYRPQGPGGAAVSLGSRAPWTTIARGVIQISGRDTFSRLGRRP